MWMSCTAPCWIPVRARWLISSVLFAITPAAKKIVALEYHAYKPMAEQKLRQIGDEIKERWGIGAVAIVHRVGNLKIGDTAVMISVASPHRAEAFAACKYAIDRIKQIVPIWKRETGENGVEWVEECEVSVESAARQESSAGG